MNYSDNLNGIAPIGASRNSIDTQKSYNKMVERLEASLKTILEKNLNESLEEYPILIEQRQAHQGMFDNIGALKEGDSEKVEIFKTFMERAEKLTRVLNRVVARKDYETQESLREGGFLSDDIKLDAVKSFELKEDLIKTTGKAQVLDVDKKLSALKKPYDKIIDQVTKDGNYGVVAESAKSLNKTFNKEYADLQPKVEDLISFIEELSKRVLSENDSPIVKDKVEEIQNLVNSLKENNDKDSPVSSIEGFDTILSEVEELKNLVNETKINQVESDNEGEFKGINSNVISDSEDGFVEIIGDSEPVLKDYSSEDNLGETLEDEIKHKSSKDIEDETDIFKAEDKVDPVLIYLSDIESLLVQILESLQNSNAGAGNSSQGETSNSESGPGLVSSLFSPDSSLMSKGGLMSLAKGGLWGLAAVATAGVTYAAYNQYQNVKEENDQLREVTKNTKEDLDKKYGGDSSDPKVKEAYWKRMNSGLSKEDVARITKHKWSAASKEMLQKSMTEEENNKYIEATRKKINDPSSMTEEDIYNSNLVLLKRRDLLNGTLQPVNPEESLYTANKYNEALNNKISDKKKELGLGPNDKLSDDEMVDLSIGLKKQYYPVSSKEEIDNFYEASKSEKPELSAEGLVNRKPANAEAAVNAVGIGGSKLFTFNEGNLSTGAPEKYAGLIKEGQISVDWGEMSKVTAYNESRGNYDIQNSLGFLGKYQVGWEALADQGYINKRKAKAARKKGKTNKEIINDESMWTGKNNIKSKMDFLGGSTQGKDSNYTGQNHQNVQEEVAREYTRRNIEALNRKVINTKEGPFSFWDASKKLNYENEQILGGAQFGIGNIHELIQTETNINERTDISKNYKRLKELADGSQIPVSFKQYTNDIRYKSIGLNRRKANGEDIETYHVNNPYNVGTALKTVQEQVENEQNRIYQSVQEDKEISSNNIYQGYFDNEGKWKGSDDYSKFKSGDFMSFKSLDIAKQAGMLVTEEVTKNEDGSTYMNKGIYVDKDGKPFIGENPEKAKSEGYKFLDINNPYYSEVMKDYLVGADYKQKDANDTEESLNMKSLHNEAIDAAKNTKSITKYSYGKNLETLAKEHSESSENGDNLPLTLVSGDGNTRTFKPNKDKGVDLNLQSTNLGIGDTGYADDNFTYTTIKPTVGNSLEGYSMGYEKAEVIDDLRGEFSYNEEGKIVNKPVYNDSIRKKHEKNLSGFSNWGKFGMFKRSKNAVKESEAISAESKSTVNLNQTAEPNKVLDVSTATPKNEVQVSKKEESLPAASADAAAPTMNKIKTFKEESKSEETQKYQKVLGNDSAAPQSASIVTIINQSINLNEQDDIGNIGATSSLR